MTPTEELRLEALERAMSWAKSRELYLNADEIVAAAKRFEIFIRSGE